VSEIRHHYTKDQIINIFKQQKDNLRAPESLVKLSDEEVPVLNKAGHADLELINPLSVPIRKGSSFSGINELHGLRYPDKTAVVDEKEEIEY